MDLIKGNRGIYSPICVLFDTPIYERAQQICWHMGTCKSQIALVTELLRLQQRNQLPSGVTAEDMTELVVEHSKGTKVWEFELEGIDDPETRLLLKMAWEVNTSMKMRDIELEARRLLNSPEAITPKFQHPKIIKQAQRYGRSLTEQQQEGPSSKLLRPHEVVMEVVPKVLQSFWVPPPNTRFNMPSKQFSEMAIGVTKAVEDRVSTSVFSMLHLVNFSRSIRDNMVMSIQEKFKQGHTRDILVKTLSCFGGEMLKTISDVVAGEICVLFQPQTHTKLSVNMNTRKDCMQPADVLDGAEASTSPAGDVNEEPGLEKDTETIRELDSAVTTPPPAPLSTSAELLGNITVLNVLNLSLTKTEEQPAHSPEPDCAVATTLPSPLTPADESPVISAGQDDLTSTTAVHNGLRNSLVEAEEQPVLSPEPDCAVATTPPSPLTPADESPVMSAGQDDLCNF